MNRAETDPIYRVSGGPIRGTARVPGDKSISHRALILAALAVGESRIGGLCGGRDVQATVAALRAMGVVIEACPDGIARVHGVGAGALIQPESALDMGNSGTSARLLAGIAASHPIRAVFVGDSSLSRRPMERVAGPLRRIGAQIDTAPGGRLPMTVAGACPAIPRAHCLDIPSAQVKSALLLAALNTPGVTEVTEIVPTRDHLERMLPLFGAEVEREGDTIRLRGQTDLVPQSLAIPGDFSSAAFLIVAALIVPGSEIRIENVGVNPRRTGLLAVLKEMGGAIHFENEREEHGEPVVDILVRHSALKGCEVPPDIAPDMIDEFPALFTAAAFAEGVTAARGLSELRHRESDRIASMAMALKAAGIEADEEEDGLSIRGLGGGPIHGGAKIDARMDHRIAMSLAVAGLHARKPIKMDGMETVSTSFPDFFETLRGLGA